MSREELIEEARAAFTEAWEAEDGRMRRLGIINDPDHPRSRAGIIAALAVFEKADAPTDGEREALEAKAWGDQYTPGMSQKEAAAFKRGHAAGWRDGGFRRSEATEPQGDEREALVTEVYGIINSHYWMAGKPGICVCGHDVDADPAGTMAEHRAQAVVDAGFRRSAVPEPTAECPQCHRSDGQHKLGCGERFGSEPQGEPSDAQVQAALTAYWGAMNVDQYGSIEGMRAALRAAREVR